MHSGERFSCVNGDCVDVLKQFPSDCIDFSCYSPPFGSLFTYSESAADMGNSTDEEFAQHYAYLVAEKLRVTKPGRLTAVHCSDLPMTKWKDGAVGIKDFSGQIIRAHEDAGWVYHGRRTIWKCPVVEMTRTKHVGLLYKQLQKDSSKSRGGMPDYLLTFVKPGDNAELISHTPADFPLEQWQEWASPVWMTIQQSNVLNTRMAKANEDERHLCPLQLDVIERAIIMWSNKNDIVLSPFAGIGSEGVVALKLGRRFVGIELAQKYWRFQCQYLDDSDRQRALDLDGYDANKDLAGSLNDGYEAIRERVAAGGPGWERTGGKK
ncbi:MAG TPA: site-specific DNA-methyltransferase [Bryobacteraceae bacterium]|nr:site-specific DNA-methyltransferase [Bryobacteraceae bacterium]